MGGDETSCGGLGRALGRRGARPGDGGVPDGIGNRVGGSGRCRRGSGGGGVRGRRCVRVRARRLRHVPDPGRRGGAGAGGRAGGAGRVRRRAAAREGGPRGRGRGAPALVRRRLHLVGAAAGRRRRAGHAGQPRARGRRGRRPAGAADHPQRGRRHRVRDHDGSGRDAGRAPGVRPVQRRRRGHLVRAARDHRAGQAARLALVRHRPRPRRRADRRPARGTPRRRREPLRRPGGRQHGHRGRAPPLRRALSAQRRRRRDLADRLHRPGG